MPERSRRPETSLPTSAALRRQAHRARHARHPATHPGLPLHQSPPAGRGPRTGMGQKPPRRSRLQHPQEAFQASPVRGPQPATLIPMLLRLVQQGRHNFPLCIRPQLESLVTHSGSSAKRPLKKESASVLEAIHATRSWKFTVSARCSRLMIDLQQMRPLRERAVLQAVQGSIAQS